ncbi:GLE1-like protein-domain-containing protein [Lasiosphaeris hirsuta]|uniref:mRNA export factor GLE1 n=1 Tax=Lasiosphaeris hirsuta TaxID=260670 RepID=A0AA40ARA7_9PEZI|nr:GLE1-like protein-domain-containing protein [Lasiosphaeris hirsuta]
MAGSSPPHRQSCQWASPNRSSIIADILGDDRNSEARHKSLLESAKKEHDRVRLEAERVYRQHMQKEEQQRLLEEKQRILEAKRREEERIRLEEHNAAERTRLHALRAKKIEMPPTPKEPEPPKATAPASIPPPVHSSSQATSMNGTTAPQALQTPALFGGNKPTIDSQPATHNSSGVQKPGPASQTTAAIQASAAPNARGKAQNNGPSLQTKPSQAPQTTQSTPQPSTPVTPDRYTVIHQNLKILRKFMIEQAKANKALKERMGDMRREIRKCVGQLTGGAGANRIQQASIINLLREALGNQVGSAPMDPSLFILGPRNPVQGALHNEPQLPSLFFYLLNIFSKATVSQFINEAGAKPETADPVGVCIAFVFSDPEFLWRGASLIDILMAKFRIVCPVLFGYRGNEKTEQGRARLGWWKDNGHWVGDQQHMDRMTGLGAGFAAVSLRKFANSKKDNPYPPRYYWAAMARIVNTPPAEMSNTQCVVLRSMIQNFEHKFIEFYGTAAIVALRMCLVEFPARAPQKTPAVGSLEVLGQVLKRDAGLHL